KVQSRPPLCEERFRCRIEEKPCRQAPPARPQDPRHFRQIVLDVGRQHVCKDGRQKYEIERVVLVRKPKLGSSPGSSGVVLPVPDIRQLKSKVRILSGDLFPAPLNALGNDVEAIITSVRREISRERDRDPANTASNVQDVLVRFQVDELLEVLRELFAYLE